MNDHPGLLSPARHPMVDEAGCRVQVQARVDHLAIVARCDLPTGSAVLFVDGPLVEQPSRYSVQVGIGEHVDVKDVDEPDARDGIPQRHLWRFLNHSCQPNAILHGRTLVALRDIAAGDEVTFDYAANEWSMAEPFDCHCGAATCRGRIAGFAALDATTQRALLPLTAPHIVEQLKNR